MIIKIIILQKGIMHKYTIFHYKYIHTILVAVYRLDDAVNILNILFMRTKFVVVYHV